MNILTYLLKDEFWIKSLEFLFRQVLAKTGALVLFCMMLVTFVDVLGRYLFDAPLPGGFEITELLLACVIFLGLPLITAENGHIDVDLLDSWIPKLLKPIQLFTINVINLLSFAVLSWMLWKFAIRAYDYEDTTAVLQIPYAGLIFMMAFTCSLATVALLIKLLKPNLALLEQGETNGS